MNQDIQQDEPTVHYISRETLRKHGISLIPWELMNKKQRVTTTNAASVTNEKAEVVDGTIRVNATGTAAVESEEQQPPCKSNGLDYINNDAEDKLSPSSFSSTSKLNDVQPVQQSRDGKSIIRQMDNSQGDECHEPSESKVEKSKQMGFFIKVDE